MASNGTHIAVADTGNHRVLIWNQFPTLPLVGADVVLGQPAFTSSDVEWISSRALSSPEALCMDGTQLIVGDSGHDRVLVFVAASETAPPVNSDSDSENAPITPSPAPPSGGEH